MHACDDSVVWNEWYPLGSTEDISRRKTFETQLLGCRLRVVNGQSVEVIRLPEEKKLPVREHLGYIWTTLGEPEHPPVAVSEYDEPDRLTLNIWSTPLKFCGYRIVENVMDNPHFMFVHPGILGDEKYAEIPDYENKVDENGELWSLNRIAWLPIIDDFATYSYRVPSPYTVFLYIHLPKAEGEEQRFDVLGVFCQPMDEESFVVHKFFCWVKEDYMNLQQVRSDQQVISVQDKLILENHVPKKLPLYSDNEHSVPCDASTDSFRAWLRDKGVRYGTC